MLRSSVARIVPSSIGISYCFPVRLSVTVRVSPAVLASAPFSSRVSVVMALLVAQLPGDAPEPGLYYPIESGGKRSAVGESGAAAWEMQGARGAALLRERARVDRHRDCHDDEHETDGHHAAGPAVAVGELWPRQSDR